MTRTRTRTVLAACSALLAAGCGGAKLAPVTGKVLVNGQPAGGAMVVFHPAASPNTTDHKPYAVAREDGTFTLGAQGKEGAAPGDYLVTVTWAAPPPAARGAAKGIAGADERAADGGDRLRGKYRDPQGSGLKANVGAGPTELPPFQLSD